MEKINWTSTTPINTNNLNQLQTNVENAINGVVLYENPSGTQELITLNDIVTNYKYIEIFYEFNNKYNSSTKIHNALNRFASLKVQQSSNDQNYYINEYMCDVYIWEGQISFERARNISFSTTGIKEISSNNNIKITKVVGYK